jgi:hypothetical protein
VSSYGTTLRKLWISDAATTSVSDVLTLVHRSSKTAGAGFGIGIVSALQNASGAAKDASRIQTVWTTATAGAEASRIDLQPIAAAGAPDTVLSAMGSSMQPRVGIGKTAPSYPLHVKGSGDTDTVARVEAAASANYVDLKMQASTGGIWTGSDGMCSATGHWGIQSASAYRIYCLSTGRTHLAYAAMPNIASAAGAVWQGVVTTSGNTTTLTGTTRVTNAAGFNYVEINPATLNDSSALTIDYPRTMAVLGAPSVTTANVPGALTATITTGIQCSALAIGAAVTQQFLATASYSALRTTNHTLTLIGATALTTGVISACSLGQITIVGDQAITVGLAATQYIAGAPIQGTNVTLTSTYSLWVDAGVSRFDDNVLIGATAAGASAAATLVLSNSATAPSASADLCHLYCADNGAGHATLAIWCEEDVVAAVGAASTEKLPILFKGVVKNIMLCA